MCRPTRSTTSGTSDGAAYNTIQYNKDDITSFYGSSCANNGKGALNTPETLPLFSQCILHCIPRYVEYKGKKSKARLCLERCLDIAEEVLGKRSTNTTAAFAAMLQVRRLRNSSNWSALGAMGQSAHGSLVDEERVIPLPPTGQNGQAGSARRRRRR
eukprot:1194453-Prorocentrum_minimum.AAC.1